MTATPQRILRPFLIWVVLSVCGVGGVSCADCVCRALCWECLVCFLLNVYVRESRDQMCASVKLLDCVLLCA